MEFDALSSRGSDPAPPAHERGLRKERPLDRDHIETRHSLGGIDLLKEHGVDGVAVQLENKQRIPSLRQMNCRNRRIGIDSRSRWIVGAAVNPLAYSRPASSD